MGVISAGVLAGLAKIGLVVVSIGGLSAGAYSAYRGGPGGGRTAEGLTAVTQRCTVEVKSILREQPARRSAWCVFF